MSVTLTGTGGLFTRLGVEIGAANHLITAFGTQLDNDTTAIFNQFLSTDQNVVSGSSGLYSYRDQARQGYSGFPNNMATLAGNTLTQMVNDDTGQNLTDPVAALRVMVAQMVANTTTLQRPVTSLTVTPNASNHGNGVIVGSLTNAAGAPLDMVFGETLTATVTADAGSNASLIYKEPLQVVGLPTYQFYDWRWPGGSAASFSMNFVDGNTTTNNLVTNGGFFCTTPNTPDGWTILVGSAGTTVLAGTSAPLRATKAYYLKFHSDGSTLIEIRQQLTTIQPSTAYNFNIFAKQSSLDASGIVTIKLVDGSGTTIQNAAGTNQTYTRNTNGQITTSWGSVNVFFQTPVLLPSAVYLSISYSTSPASGIETYFDLAGVTAATQAYSGGPFLAAWAQSVQAQKGDYYSIAVTNQEKASTSWAGTTAYSAFALVTNGGNVYRCTTGGTSAGSGGPTGTGAVIVDGSVIWTYLCASTAQNIGGTQSFVRRLDSMFNLRTNSIAFPTASSPTVADSLITY